MPTRDQQRAAVAYAHVSEYLYEHLSGSLKEEKKAEAKKYASIVHALPALLQTAGLCQALHFVRSRSDKVQQAIVDHLADQLAHVNPTIKNGDDLLKRTREADLGEYLQLTDEAMTCAAWYRRLVQGVLKIEASDGET